MSAETDAGKGGYRITLPEFEGPLDLLLHLCKTHELDIVNIPIAFVTQKYLEYLEVMQSMSVDIAADYLVMAAQLAYLKSRELVPTPEPIEAAGEEAEAVLDPREELIRRLLEYQKYKHAAERLGGRPIEGRTVFARGMPIEVDDATRPLAEQSVWKLIEAFGKILEKAGKKITTHNVVVDRVSIGTRIKQLADRLEAGGGTFRFDACFDMALPEAELRDQVVVTLLAILELAKLKLVRVLQSPDDETLFISHVPGTSLDVARRIHATSDDTADEASDEAQAASPGDAPAEAQELAPAVVPEHAPEHAPGQVHDEAADAAELEEIDEILKAADDAAAEEAEFGEDEGERETPAEMTGEETAEAAAEETTEDATEEATEKATEEATEEKDLPNLPASEQKVLDETETHE